MKKRTVTVIGSINMDLVTTTRKRPNIGETVFGQSFTTVPGGKGANQAVAAARLGSKVNLIGKVGEDTFGKTLREHLKKEGIHLYGKEKSSENTGIAAITVSNGDNSIIVVPGANNEVSPLYVQHFEDIVASSDIVLLQLEIPLETIEFSVELANKHDIPVILNPAPIRTLSQQLLEKITFITPNEHESDSLDLGLKVLKEKVIVTKGEKGVEFWNGERIQKLPCYSVGVVDSTGAGDAFNGALAVAVSEGKGIEEACRFASAVAALTVTKLGAQTGMPTRAEVEEFLRRRRE
jgi:ribokinase